MEGPAFIDAIEMFSKGDIGLGAKAVAEEPLTYRSAGVDIDAGEELVEVVFLLLLSPSYSLTSV